MPEAVRVDCENISNFAQLYVSVFNAPPWSDGWSVDAVVERFVLFAQMPRFYGAGLTQKGEPSSGLWLGERWVTGWPST